MKILNGGSTSNRENTCLLALSESGSCSSAGTDDQRAYCRHAAASSTLFARQTNADAHLPPSFTSKNRVIVLPTSNLHASLARWTAPVRRVKGLPPITGSPPRLSRSPPGPTTGSLAGRPLERRARYQVGRMAWHPAAVHLGNIYPGFHKSGQARGWRHPPSPAPS